jgi:hypothetical protein
MASDEINEQQETQPSQISGQLKVRSQLWQLIAGRACWLTFNQSAQGMAYSAIGSVLPAGLSSDGWAESGAELQKEGADEVKAAKGTAASEATWESAGAKVKS